MAHAETHTRLHCAACGYHLKPLDGLHDHCTACRAALVHGRKAWGKRMNLIRKTRRAQGLTPVLPADPFQGFRDAD